MTTYIQNNETAVEVYKPLKKVKTSKLNEVMLPIIENFHLYIKEIYQD